MRFTSLATYLVLRQLLQKTHAEEWTEKLNSCSGYKRLSVLSLVLNNTEDMTVAATAIQNTGYWSSIPQETLAEYLTDAIATLKKNGIWKFQEAELFAPVPTKGETETE